MVELLGGMKGCLENEGQDSEENRGQEYAREWLSQYIPAQSLGIYCQQYPSFSEAPIDLA